MLMSSKPSTTLYAAPRFVVLLSILLNATALQAQASSSNQDCPAPFSSIAPPNDKLIGKIGYAENWRNPYVMVSAEGYELILRSRPRSDERMSLDEMRRRLEILAASEWPLGRVVAVQENGLASRRSIVTQRIGELRLLLKTLCLRFDPWPSA
jgi:hypothetical protein